MELMRIVAGIQKCIRSSMRNYQQMGERLIVTGRYNPRRQVNTQLSTLNCQLPTLSLLNHFLELRAEHIHAPVIVKISAECNVKPISPLAFDGEFADLRNVHGPAYAKAGSAN